MFGLGWYLDVIGSDSHILVEFLRIFEEKSQKRKTRVGLLHRSEGTHAVAKLFVAAKQNSQNGHPRVRCSEKVLRRGEGTVHIGKIFGFCSKCLVFVRR